MGERGNCEGPTEEAEIWDDRTMAKKNPDCTKCGVCCISLEDQTAFCDLSSADEARLGKKLSGHAEVSSLWCLAVDRLRGAGHCGAAIKTKWKKVGAGPLKGFSVCSCCFLDGSPLLDVRCRVYADRPEVCRRAFNPGDKGCVVCRRMFAEFVERLEE